MLIMLRPDGVKRPYRVCTMDYVWKEAALSEGHAVYFFTDKLRMMQFVLKYGIEKGDRPVAVTVKDGTEDSMAMGASLYAMGLVELNIHPTEEVL